MFGWVKTRQARVKHNVCPDGKPNGHYGWHLRPLPQEGLTPQPVSVLGHPRFVRAVLPQPKCIELVPYCAAIHSQMPQSAVDGTIQQLSCGGIATFAQIRCADGSEDNLS